MRKNNLLDILIAGTAILLTMMLLMTSCKHEAEVVPKSSDDGNNSGGGGNNGSGSDCDPNTVYFQNTILPLLQGNCASSNCHDANDPEDGVQLTDYANILATAEVQPGDPSDSKLFEVLIDSDPDDRMPPAGQPQLSQAQIDLVYTWIAQGAQNNVCNSANCDTSAVTYANTIAPLMQNKCVGCHSGSNPGGNVLLTSYATVVAAGQTGQLLGSVERVAPYSPMPKGGNALPACEIASIRTWVREGYAQ